MFLAYALPQFAGTTPEVLLMAGTTCPHGAAQEEEENESEEDADEEASAAAESDGEETADVACADIAGPDEDRTANARVPLTYEEKFSGKLCTGMFLLA